MMWLISKMAFVTAVLALLATQAMGAALDLNQPLGVPPALFLSLLGLAVGTGMAWADLRGRVRSIEEDVKDLKHRQRGKDE